MEIFVVGLFPGMLDPFLQTSIVGRAVEQGALIVRGVDVRPFGSGRHRTVDDTPYGGGSGMVMRAPPLVDAMESIGEPRPHRILLGPAGRRLNQGVVRELRGLPRIALVCARYEGFDERVRAFVDDELSLGDFVLTGGEPAAMVVIDAIARLLPGVVGNEQSVETESHGVEGLLEYPQYTRPLEFRGLEVPSVLRCGDHGRIARWRRWQSLRRTRDRRPDLLAEHPLSPDDAALIDREEP